MTSENAHWFLLAILVAVIASISFLAADRMSASAIPIGDGVVVGKVFNSATHSTGVGYASTGRGGGPVVVSSSTPEQWILIVKHDNETFSAKVDSDTWGSVDDGMEVEVLEIRGRMSNYGKTIRLK